MKSAVRTWCAVLAAAGIGLIASSQVRAQYQISDGGRARDASNQIGSNGYNTDRAPNPAMSGNQIRYGASGNQIVTGNVTGGKAFRGAVPYTDPFSLRIRTPGTGVDRFIRDSNGVPAPYTSGQNNPNWNPQPYYGQSQTATPPPGYVRPPNNNTGYVPAFTQSSARQPGDLRLGDPLGSISGTLPPVGLYSGPGQVDPSSGLSASPLYGLRFDELSGLNENDASYAGSSLYTRSLGSGNTPGRTRLNDTELQRMQSELRGNVVSDGQATAAPGQSQQQSGATAVQNGSVAPTPAGAAPAAKSMDAGAMAAPALQSPALTSEISSVSLANNTAGNQSVRQNLLVSAAVEQSTQYAEMQRRLEAFNKAHPNMTDADAQRQFQEQVKAQQAAATAQQGGENKGEPGAQPNAKPNPTATPPGVGPSAPTNAAPTKDGSESPKIPETALPAPAKSTAPLKVTTLAEGVKAKGFAELLTTAEDLMREGKFSSAIDRYADAEEVAGQNNPLVWMGKANAELGASYYARAEADLRHAFTADPSLLMAQYDLHGFYGPDRLAFLIKDLKEIATAEQDQPRPVFLLAYIAYNTGEERKAAAYLDLAEKRSAGKDPVLTLLREHWTLPAKDAKQPAQTDVNK